MSKHASQNHERTFSIEREQAAITPASGQIANGSCGPTGSALTNRESKDSINMPPITEESNTGPSSSSNSLDKAIPTVGEPVTTQSSEDEEGSDFLDMSW